MFGRTSQVSPLESRKQLLIAESELNRAQLSEEWQAMTHGVRDLTHQVKTIGAWASTAAMLVAGLTAWRRGPPPPAAAKLSWFQKLLHGARLASTIWLALQAHAQKDEPE